MNDASYRWEQAQRTKAEHLQAQLRAGNPNVDLGDVEEALGFLSSSLTKALERLESVFEVLNTVGGDSIRTELTLGPEDYEPGWPDLADELKALGSFLKEPVKP